MLANEIQNKRKYEALLSVDNIPEYLKKKRQWIMWRYVWTAGKNKPTKVPYHASGRYKASTTDPNTWSEFDVCLQAYAAGKFDGIGFVFWEGDNLFGADLDHCFDEGGCLEPWAAVVVEQFCITYIERSPSGDGLHIIGFGKPVLSGKSKKWKKPGEGIEQGLELYDYRSPRYFTVTGDIYNNMDVADCQNALDWIYQEYFCKSHPIPTPACTGDGNIDPESVLQALRFIPADDYKTWLDIGMALKSSGFDLDLWDEWSKSPSNTRRAFAMQNGNHSNEKIGIGTLFHIAKEHGFEFPKQTSHNPGQLEIARHMCSSFGDGNLIFVQGNFYCWNEQNWRQLNNLDLEQSAKSAYEGLGLGYKVTGSSPKNIVSLARSEVYKPDVEFDRPSESVSFLNGELYVSDHGYELRPHKRERYRLSLIPHNFDSEAKAP